jgi:hypothetical protein
MEAIVAEATMTETTMVATAPDIPVEATEVAINRAPIERQATKAAIER